MTRLGELAHEAGRAQAPAVTVHQAVRLSNDYLTASGVERPLGRGSPQQLCEDIHIYEELGVPVIVCNFATPNVMELWTAMEGFATEVMPYFSERT